MSNDYFDAPLISFQRHLNFTVKVFCQDSQDKQNMQKHKQCNIISQIKPPNDEYPDSKIHGANMGRTWALSAPGGSHVNPRDFAIGVT